MSAQMKWKKKHIGMIRYCGYWQKYCLVLDVDTENHLITELDGFGEVNHLHEHQVRTHRTALNSSDRFLTVEEFFKESIKR